MSSRKSVTAKEAARAEASGSTVTEMRRATALPVLKSEVSLTLNANSFLDFSASALYYTRSGRANLDAKRGTEPGTIVIYASCDSLQRLVEYYERLTCKYKETLDRQSEEVKEEKKPPGVWWRVLAVLTIGFFTGIVITLKTKRRNGKE